MTLYYPDVSHFQGAIDWHEVKAEGFSAACAKVSEGDGWTDDYWPANRDGIRAAGLPVMGYHYVRTGSAAAQAETCRRHLGDPSIAVMLDHEDGSGDIHNLWNTWQAFTDAGLTVKCVYLPSWYWQRIGRPSLTGLPPIVSSRYPSTAPGYASVLYRPVRDDMGKYWAAYGGVTPTVLQFADSATIAGSRMDCNAFEGTPAQLAALFDPKPQEDDMDMDTPVPVPSEAQPGTVGEALQNLLFSVPDVRVDGDVAHALRQLEQSVDGLAAATEESVWHHQIPTPGYDDEDRTANAETIAGYTDSRHKDVMAKLAAVSAKLDTMSGNLSDGQANVLAAVAGIEAGQVDVDALADALAPLLPTSADFIDALAARLRGDS